MERGQKRPHGPGDAGPGAKKGKKKKKMGGNAPPKECTDAAQRIEARIGV